MLVSKFAHIIHIHNVEKRFRLSLKLFLCTSVAISYQFFSHSVFYLTMISCITKDEEKEEKRERNLFRELESFLLPIELDSFGGLE